MYSSFLGMFRAKKGLSNGDGVAPNTYSARSTVMVTQDVQLNGELQKQYSFREEEISVCG